MRRGSFCKRKNAIDDGPDGEASLRLAEEMSRRGVRAIEAFGDKQWTAPACMLPVDYLLAVGFKTVRPHHRHPRLRMELRSTLSWREDVEVALERLLGSMTPERVLRPAPAPAVVSGQF